MNGFLIQIKNKTNKIIKLNNEIAHERIPNTNQKYNKWSPPAGRPAFFPFFAIHKVSRMFHRSHVAGRPAGGQTAGIHVFLFENSPITKMENRSVFWSQSENLTLANFIDLRAGTRSRKTLQNTSKLGAAHKNNRN